MTGNAVRHVIEAFFRRWPFYLLILLASLGLGAMNVSRTIDNYTSSGSIFVDSQSLVAAQTGVQDRGFLSFLTPAQFTGQELNGLLSTEIFMESVVERAGVDLAALPAERSRQLNQLRGAVRLSASSENLLQINVTTTEPQLSADMAEAVVAEFVSFQIAVDIAESGASEEFFTGLVADYEQDVLNARRAVDTALRGVTTLEELTPERQREIERLQADEALAVSKFQAAVEDVEVSQLASLQTETDVRQSYSIFDPPQVPVSPQGTLLDDVTVIISFLIAGLMLVAIGPIASALLNRAVLFPDDLDLGPIKVIATLPKVRRRVLRLDKVPPDAAGPVEETAGDVATVARRTITFLPDAPDVPISEPIAGDVPVDTVKPAKSAPSSAPDPKVETEAPSAEAAAEPEPVAEPEPASEPAEASEPAPEPAAVEDSPVAEETAAPVTTVPESTESEADVESDIMSLGDALLEVTDLNDLDWDDEPDDVLAEPSTGNGGNGNGNGNGTSADEAEKAEKGSSRA